MSVLLLNANALKIPLADGSVHCIVTSPPYYGLRDYGTARWQGGDPACDHIESGRDRGARDELPAPPAGWAERAQGKPHKATCRKCGARRIDDQLGLEESPEAYIARMVEVFRECWRVLRDDGTLWCNIGDSYAGSGGYDPDSPSNASGNSLQSKGNRKGKRNIARRAQSELKPKDLIGIPWMLAFALRADGWYLRSEIIWHKPNPMPESATDRPTKSHEQLFLLSKSAHYYYDQDAIREPQKEFIEYEPGPKANVVKGDSMNGGFAHKEGGFNAARQANGIAYNPAGRNRRTVWTIATSPYPGSHFATYPPALVEPCIKAGTSERGACPVCGAPWERMTEDNTVKAHDGKTTTLYQEGTTANRLALLRQAARERGEEYSSAKVTLGWQPGCEHDAAPVPCVVFDPFAGSGTTLQVARSLGRSGIGTDLSLTYLQKCARTRLELDALDAWTRGIPARAGTLSDLPLFGGTV